MRVPGVVVLAAAIVIASSAAAPVPAAAADQQYFWRWSDGDPGKGRTLAQATYDSPDELPRIVVTASPPAPRHRVSLQFRDGQRWRTDDTAVTSTAGTATLSLNPFCADGRWCVGRFDYRLVIDGRVASFTVAFRR